MKIKYMTIGLVAMLIFATMSGCSLLVKTNKVSLSSSVSQSNSNTTVSQSLLENNSNISGENFLDIPINDEDVSIPIPSFLNTEQKNLYIKAYKFFAVFAIETLCLDTMFPDDYSGDYSTKEIFVNDISYLKAIGRYSVWNDFMSVCEALFTDSYFKELNKMSSLNDAPQFIDIDGITHFHNIVGSMNPGYDREAMPETFELIEKSDVKIEFKVIAETTVYAYNENTNETYIDGTNIHEYTIILVKTENGWRFSKFNIPY